MSGKTYSIKKITCINNVVFISGIKRELAMVNDRPSERCSSGRAFMNQSVTLQLTVDDFKVLLNAINLFLSLVKHEAIYELAVSLLKFEKMINFMNATAKWVITPVTNMKGVLGRLNMNFPDAVEWNIWIYTQADKKMVNSFYQSHNTKSYNLSPGEYRLLLTTVPVENVPIQKGYDTRLKAGFLNLVSEGSWELYDATKENIYTSNTKPQKIALPVGSYQLNLGGQFYPVVIKDKVTVEY